MQSVLFYCKKARRRQGENADLAQKVGTKIALSCWNGSAANPGIVEHGFSGWNSGYGYFWLASLTIRSRWAHIFRPDCCFSGGWFLVTFHDAGQTLPVFRLLRALPGCGLFVCVHTHSMTQCSGKRESLGFPVAPCPCCGHKHNAVLRLRFANYLAGYRLPGQACDLSIRVLLEYKLRGGVAGVRLGGII